MKPIDVSNYQTYKKDIKPSKPFKKNKVEDVPEFKGKMEDPLYKQHQFWFIVLVFLFFASIAAYMSYAYPKAEKQKLSQTEYVTKLGAENAQYQIEIGIEMAKQVQMAKDKKAKEEAYNKSSEIYSGSVGKVLELKEKIRLNEEKMQEQIIN